MCHPIKIILVIMTFFLFDCSQVSHETQKEGSSKGQIVKGPSYKTANVCVIVTMMYNKLLNIDSVVTRL